MLFYTASPILSTCHHNKHLQAENPFTSLMKHKEMGIIWPFKLLRALRLIDKYYNSMRWHELIC